MAEQNTKSAELPLYQSLKQVRATKILKMYPAPRQEGELKTKFILETEHGIIMVDDKYMDKHQPQLGGYYVRYKDGYESWSPVDAFDDGHCQAVGNEGDLLVIAERMMKDEFDVGCDAEMVSKQSVDNMSLATRIGQLESDPKIKISEAIQKDLDHCIVIAVTYGSRITEYLSRMVSIVEYAQKKD